MRLKDADEAIRKIMDEMQRLLEQQSQFVGKSTGMVNNIQNTRYGLAKAIDILYEQPTIEDRKKGHWISLDDFRGKYNDYGYKCSECGEHSEYEENYCPNCGARMRGEDDDTR